MYRKVANRITDKNTIISVLMTENQMMNDAFQAKIEEMKERMECFEREVTRQMEETNVKTQQMLENTKQMVKLEIRLDVEARLKREADSEAKIKREAAWDKCGTGIVLSGDGLVATLASEGMCMSRHTTQPSSNDMWRLVTGGEPMMEGRHYWEVELTSPDFGGNREMMVGAVRPGLDHDIDHFNGNDAYYISGYSGGIYGNGKKDTNRQSGGSATDHRIGVLLDLDSGWLRFYRNGMRWGPGFTEGVTGPLVRGVEFYTKGYNKVTVLHGAVEPSLEKRKT